MFNLNTDTLKIWLHFNGIEIQQWFIISTPNNPLIKAVVDQVIKNIHIGLLVC